MPRTAGSRVVFVACLALLLTACGEAAPAARTAAQRFDDAITLVAKALGKSKAEVRVGFETRLPTATIDELAAQAERTAARTAEIERLAAQAAQAAAKAEQAAARERAMAETLYGATCDYIDIATELSSAPPDEQWSAFEAILIQKLVEHNFTTTQADVEALSKDVHDLWNSVSGNATRPLSEIATDLACFAS